MPKKPPASLFTTGKRKLQYVRPELVPDLAALLIIHLERCEAAKKKQERMAKMMPDGTWTTTPDYYRHASGYLRFMLYGLAGGHNPALIEAAREAYREAEAKAERFDQLPLPGTEGGE